MTKYYQIVDQDLILISLFCIQKSAMKLFRFEMTSPPPSEFLQKFIYLGEKGVSYFVGWKCRYACWCAFWQVVCEKKS